MEGGAEEAFTFQEENALAYLETIEESPNVRAVSRVTQNEDPSVHMGPPVLSPGSDAIVYTIRSSGERKVSNIWMLASSGSAQTRVTVGNWLDVTPSFTPDGKELIFASNRSSSQPCLWKIRAGGSGGITRITSSNAADMSPSVAPNGKLIAYTSVLPAGSGDQIWTTTITGQMVTQLRKGAEPQFSPDGQKILFVRENDSTHNGEIWIMDTDGGQETQLTANSKYNFRDPKWSRDGAWIVFSSNEGLNSNREHNFDIWMMRKDGSSPTSLTTNGSHDDSPSWSRDGRKIFFRSNRGGAWNIWQFEPVL